MVADPRHLGSDQGNGFPMKRQAAFFNIGDPILWGKYKNKKGVITGFGLNEKGQPTVTIDPVPKGNRKSKTMNLFNVWKPNAKAASHRVVARYQSSTETI